jgi:hypothetical protein
MSQRANSGVRIRRCNMTMNSFGDDLLLTVSEAANFLRISRRTLDNLCSDDPETKAVATYVERADNADARKTATRGNTPQAKTG